MNPPFQAHDVRTMFFYHFEVVTTSKLQTTSFLTSYIGLVKDQFTTRKRTESAQKEMILKNFNSTYLTKPLAFPGEVFSAFHLRGLRFKVALNEQASKLSQCNHQNYSFS